jgi:hypothetical protein
MTGLGCQLRQCQVCLDCKCGHASAIDVEGTVKSQGCPVFGQLGAIRKEVPMAGQAFIQNDELASQILLLLNHILHELLCSAESYT